MNSSNPTPHKRIQRSTTLNRKYVKRPTPRIRNTSEIHEENMRRRKALAGRMSRDSLISKNISQKQPTRSKVVTQAPLEKVEKHPIEVSARKKLEKKLAMQESAPTMRERKDQAISDALKKMTKATPEQEKKKLHKSFLSLKRVVLAFCLAILVIGGAVYFIQISAPSISVKVAAMQAGIEAIYPSFTPKGFSLSEVSAEETRIILKFSDDNNASYAISEEKSAWNSSALEENYIKPKFNRDYTTIREQGLTIFVAGGSGIWVNGGKLFIISSDSLSRDQLVLIATSL